MPEAKENPTADKDDENTKLIDNNGHSADLDVKMSEEGPELEENQSRWWSLLY